jgi:hypothetical protein
MDAVANLEINVPRRAFGIDGFVGVELGGDGGGKRLARAGGSWGLPWVGGENAGGGQKLLGRCDGFLIY